jgi:RND superfamily putative drug exporter
MIRLRCAGANAVACHSDWVFTGQVFLVSRIREYWLASDRTPAANDESVALGLTRTGRVITAAAVIMSISFAALAAANVSFMRMFGVGLTLAILVDATIIRTVLVPALMHLMGRLNWWAPKPLARLHDRIGLSESAAGPQDEVEDRWQAFGRIENCEATAAAFDATLAG